MKKRVIEIPNWLILGMAEIGSILTAFFIIKIMPLIDTRVPIRFYVGKDKNQRLSSS